MKMMLRKVLFFLFMSISFFASAQEILRGEVVVDLEPVYGFFVDEFSPLDRETAYRRLLEDAALFFSEQIYGWNFHYDIGEKARGIAEEFKLEPEGEILWGDPALKVTHAQIFDNRIEAWMDYRMRDSQIRRVGAWKSGVNRTAQAMGYSELGLPETANWIAIRKAALEDAARSALRAMLQGSERNRPKEAAGYIGLQAFPRFFMSGGRWACSARFFVDIQEIVPYSAY